MLMKQKNDTNFAKLYKIRAGDIIKVDSGFSCIPAGALRQVYDHMDGYYIKCCGIDCDSPNCRPTYEHFLDGQLADDNETLIGIYMFEE